MSTFDSTLWGSTLPGGIGGAAVLVSELVYAALRKAGVLAAPGRGYTQSESSDTLTELNRMLGSWNTLRANIFTLRIDPWSTVARQQIYTLGPGGDWDGPRPQAIVRANLLLPTAPTIRRPMAIWDDGQWARIKLQAVYTYPEGLYSDGAFPLTNIYLRPIPDAIYQIELYTWQALVTYMGLSDPVLLPPGYEDAIVNNLAVRLASMPWTHQVPMNSLVAMEARRSLALIQQYNTQAPRLKSDPELTIERGVLNWMTGQVEG